jgi:hypothetical protein
MKHFLLATALLAACGPSARNGGGDDEPGADAAVTGDAGECTDVVDVVFVLDTSSSMGFVLQQLEQQIAQVVTASNTLAPNAHFGLIVFQDNHVLDNTGPLEGGKVHTEASTLQTRFNHYRTVYTNNNRNPADGASGLTMQNPICEENSLDALYAAANEFPWRPNATRVVIVATDDTFLESPDNYGDRDNDGLTNKTDYPREGDYPAMHALGETVTALRDAKIRVFSFSRITQPGILDRCSTGRRLPWADITDGWSTPYGTTPPIPSQTDGGNFDLDQVRSNAINLSTTINNVVLDSYCNPIIL